MMNLRSFFPAEDRLSSFSKCSPRTSNHKKSQCAYRHGSSDLAGPPLQGCMQCLSVSTKPFASSSSSFGSGSGLETNSSSEYRRDNRHHLTQGHGDRLDRCIRMVLLTMTPFIVGAISTSKEIGIDVHQQSQASPEADASLKDPAIGKPISHGQIVQLWKLLKDHDAQSYTLENLLWGARVYVPPAPPKPEPVRAVLSCLSTMIDAYADISFFSSQTNTKP